MKFLENLLDKIEPATKGNKFLHTTYDAIATFLFQPKETTLGRGAHIKDGMDLKRTMFHVVIAMQLALIHGIINIGHQHYASMGLFPDLFDLEGLLFKAAYGLLQILPLIIVVHVVGLGIEFFFAALKGHSVEEGFLVSGMLIPLIMPPDVPLWMVAVATAFAVVVAKEAFGGTGMNILNVALTARVFIFFAYPGEISGDDVWVAHDYNLLHQLVGLKAHTLDMLAAKGKDIAAITEGGWQWRKALVDGYSGATPLAVAVSPEGVGGWTAIQNVTLPDGTQKYSVFNLWMGFIPGSIGETNKVFIILGAIILMLARIASWRIIFSMVLGCATAGILMNAMGGFDNGNQFIDVPWYYQFLMGGFFFAMAFMATDPVTAAATNTGKLIYGFSIGMLGLVVRVINPAYPEGWMLAILFMNVFAPLIDHFVLESNMKRRLSRAV